MTGDVVSLQERRPHLSGPVRCMECGHQWAAVAPIGTCRLECPGCRCWKGVWIGATEADEGKAAWICQCGNDAFQLLPHAIRCLRCGTDAAGYP